MTSFILATMAIILAFFPGLGQCSGPMAEFEKVEYILVTTPTPSLGHQKIILKIAKYLPINVKMIVHVEDFNEQPFANGLLLPILTEIVLLPKVTMEVNFLLINIEAT